MSKSNLSVWTARTKFGEKGLTKSNISDIFYQLAVNDEDFNGNNGEEYLWESAKKGEEYTTDNGCKAISYSATRK